MTLANKNGRFNELHVEIADIEVAVNKLHKLHAIDCDQLTIMHVLYAHPVLLVLFKVLFNNKITYGVTPTKFSHSVVLPIVKDTSKSVNDPCNYRPISIIF